MQAKSFGRHTAVSSTSKSLAEYQDATVEQFEQEIQPLRRPAVLRGLVKSWPLVKKATEGRAEFLRWLAARDRGEPVGVFTGEAEIEGRIFYRDDMRGFNFNRGKSDFTAFLKNLDIAVENKSKKAIYMGATPVTQCLKGFDADHRAPVGCVKTMPNIWLGNAITIAPHFDTSENLACVVAGKRRFTLFPPDQIENLYVGPIDFTPAGQPVSMVDFRAPDLEMYPRFKKAMEASITAELEPGDVLYIPSLWWHGVESLHSFNGLVNYWWSESGGESASPMEALILGIVAIRKLPEAQREAWQALFDYYLFSTQRHPLEHLPQEQRGILGELPLPIAEKIKSQLARALVR